jgi:hypothetical protein
MGPSQRGNILGQAILDNAKWIKLGLIAVRYHILLGIANYVGLCSFGLPDGQNPGYQFHVPD